MRKTILYNIKKGTESITGSLDELTEILNANKNQIYYSAQVGKCINGWHIRKLERIYKVYSYETTYDNMNDLAYDLGIPKDTIISALINDRDVSGEYYVKEVIQ